MTTAADVQERVELDRSVVFLLIAAMAAALVAMPLLEPTASGRLATQVVIVMMLFLGGIDITTGRVPNAVVYPAIAFGLAATAIAESEVLPDAALGAACGLGVMFVLALIGRGSMGMGDVKFAALMGCITGWKGAIAALVLGFAAGGVFALAVLLLRLRSRKDFLPLTPFLAAGGVAYGVLFGFILWMPDLARLT